MAELNREELGLFIDWVRSNKHSDALDPPHAHLDDFFSEWKNLDDDDYSEVFKQLELHFDDAKDTRYIAIVFDIAEDESQDSWWALGISQLLTLTVELGVAPAVYLPKKESSVRDIDCFATHKYHLSHLDKHSFKAKMTVIQWESGVDECDAHFEYVNH